MEFKPLHKAFRIIYQGIPRELASDIGVGLTTISGVKPATIVDNPIFKKFKGIWDTGATGTVITEKVVTALNLKQIGLKKVIGVNSEDVVPTFLVNIYLPNNVFFTPVEVTVGKIGDRYDVLIGMDIIMSGDFCISNTKGNTRFTYCLPPHDNPTCLLEKSNRANVSINKHNRKLARKKK